MKINCNIADDLLPLYLEDSCSEDSRAALEEHLESCPSCRAKLDRMGRAIPGDMGEEGPTPKLADYARKVRKHRLRMMLLAIVLTLAAAFVLALVGLTVLDMRRQSAPTVHKVEEGTCNLTAGDLNTTGEEIGAYLFYTNSTQIEVQAQQSGDPAGTVLLWDAADGENFIQKAGIDEKTGACTFTNLSAANRYRITCEGLDGVKLTVSEGRRVSFWGSLRSVCGELLGLVG